MKIKIIIALALVIIIGSASNAQIVNPKETVKTQGTNRANDKIEQGVDAGFNKIEEGVGNLFKKKNNKNSKNNDEAEEELGEGSENEVYEENNKNNSSVNNNNQQKLESYTKYDFVAGDKVLYYEDFSQDAIGDFPALWTSNGSGEVKNINIAPGKWFHLNGEDAVYCYTKPINFPDNFIIEFDIIPDAEYEHGIRFSLYEEAPDAYKELEADLYPGKGGLHIFLRKEEWNTIGYSNEPENEWLTGKASKNPVITEQVNHVIMWMQKRRLRIYHQGAKVLDVPTQIYAHTKFNRFHFLGWDAHSYPMISNFKITTASPDTRSKLITDGKLITYGITFDVNKSDIKPESYGTLNDIAKVLKENSDVKIKIIGHTDSDGEDAFNLDLSKSRAMSVKNELVTKFGIATERISTDGEGESRPIVPNDTPSNKAINRRVEFIKL